MDVPLLLAAAAVMGVSHASSSHGDVALRAHRSRNPADSSVCFYFAGDIMEAPSTAFWTFGKHIPDPANLISKDSAKVLLGDFLFRELQRTMDHQVEVGAAIEDWALPPTRVSGLCMLPGDRWDGAPSSINGVRVSSFYPRAHPATYASLREMASELHLGAGADYVIDGIPATAERARAVIDSGIVGQIDLVKPRRVTAWDQPPLDDFDRRQPVNGAILITTRRP